MINAGKREDLIQRRKTALMSQNEVAVKLGISQARYSLIENGYYNPNPKQAEILLELFGIEPKYFQTAVEAGGA